MQLLPKRCSKLWCKDDNQSSRRPASEDLSQWGFFFTYHDGKFEGYDTVSELHFATSAVAVNRSQKSTSSNKVGTYKKESKWRHHFYYCCHQNNSFGLRTYYTRTDKIHFECHGVFFLRVKVVVRSSIDSGRYEIPPYLYRGRQSDYLSLDTQKYRPRRK